jgi:hypothetical protein
MEKNMKSCKNNLKALWVICPILLMLLVSVTQIQAYQLFWLQDTEFVTDLGGWFTAFENPVGHSSTFGTVEWSSAYGGSAHLVVSGAPCVADLISFFGTTIYPGDTIACTASTGTMTYATLVLQIGGYGNDFTQAVSLTQSTITQDMVIIADKIYPPGTPILIHLVCWPGSGEAWIQYVHFGRGGLGIFEEQNPSYIPTPTNGSLLRNPVPNPANKNVRIAFAVNERTQATVKIYDKNGRLVKDYDEGTLNAGEHEIIWNGKDNNGKAVPSEIYFYELNAGGKTSIRKSVIIH